MSVIPSPSMSPRLTIERPNWSISSSRAVNPPEVELIFCALTTYPIWASSVGTALSAKTAEKRTATAALGKANLSVRGDAPPELGDGGAGFLNYARKRDSARVLPRLGSANLVRSQSATVGSGRADQNPSTRS